MKIDIDYKRKEHIDYINLTTRLISNNNPPYYLAKATYDEKVQELEIIIEKTNDKSVKFYAMLSKANTLLDYGLLKDNPDKKLYNNAKEEINKAKNLVAKKEPMSIDYNDALSLAKLTYKKLLKLENKIKQPYKKTNKTNGMVFINL